MSGDGKGEWTVLVLALLLLLRSRRKTSWFAAGALPAIGVLVVCAPARAQQLRIGPPATSLPDDLGALERAAPVPADVRPGVRIGVTYLEDPLVAIVGDDEIGLLSERLSLSATASVAFLERAFVSVSGALHVQGGTGANGVGVGPVLDNPAAGPPTLDARVVILDRREVFELAVATTLRLPFGSSHGFAIDTEASVWPRAIATKTFDDRGSLVGMSVGVDVRPETRFADLEVGPQFTFVIGGAIAVGEQTAVTLELEGATVLARAFDLAHTPIRTSLGLRWRQEPISVMAWAGTGLTPGFGAPDAVVGLAFGSWIPVAEAEAAGLETIVP
ncbi:MAG: hypothetical protein RLO52_07250 [Sandaracinaceae bacterium]